MAKLQSKTWTWHFDSPVAKIWPLLADTARFGQAAGLPAHQIQALPRPDGSVLHLGRVRVGPFKWFPLEWEDQPHDWVINRWFRHPMYFRSGPLKFVSASFKIFPEGTGSRGEYTLAVEPANLFSRLLLAAGFFQNLEATFSQLAKDAADFSQGRRHTEFDHPSPVLIPGAQARAAGLVKKIESTPHGHGLAAKLADYVLTRQDIDVWSIRPLKLARLWGVAERLAIEVCLEATKQGLLGMRWELLCPRCQVGKKSVASLKELPKGAHCDSCNIDFNQAFSKNVELAFHPSHTLRPLDNVDYCLSGPMSTPHVKLQLRLEPRQRRVEAMDLPHGHYRLRTLEPGAEETVHWEAGGFPEVIARGQAITAGLPAEPGCVILNNDTDRTLTFVIEERAWLRDALTAHRATSLQAFRDLFSDEVLKPGDDVEIDAITMMFTDLKGSTALYDRIGDPQAYSLVREHFAILGEAVRHCNGSIVKLLGDAIMAVFVNPADALRCGIRIHQDIAAFNATSGREPLTLKLGLHLGRCISVTLNERLDYYGSAANKAARLQGQSRGGDIVISPEFAADPAVRERLAELAPVAEEAKLKGFHNKIRLLRITAERLCAMRGDDVDSQPSLVREA